MILAGRENVTRKMIKNAEINRTWCTLVMLEERKYGAVPSNEKMVRSEGEAKVLSSQLAIRFSLQRYGSNTLWL